MVLPAPRTPDLTPNHKWILALLYAGAGRLKFNAPVAGRTRLMKELFLLREQARVSGAFYDFESSNYGPSSNDVMQDLGAMIQRGLVQVGEGFGGSYSLTQKGFDEGARVWTSLPDDARRKIIGIKERYNFMPLSELLFHVYQGFPRYTDKSLIKDQVLAEFDQAGGAVKE